MGSKSVVAEVVEHMDSDYVRGLPFHSQSHRAYRAVRSRVALRMSPLHPAFAETVLEEFRRVTAFLRLEKPRGPRGE